MINFTNSTDHRSKEGLHNLYKSLISFQLVCNSTQHTLEITARLENWGNVFEYQIRIDN